MSGEAMADPVRTDLNCTECTQNFIAQLDMALDGNHVIECPYCGHEHCRVVTKGEVTGDRWESRNTDKKHVVDKACVWKSDHEPIITNIASAFIREKWLNRIDVIL